MRVPPVLLLLLVCPCFYALCPSGCKCTTSEGEQKFYCNINGTLFLVEGTVDNKVTIKCLSGNVTCEELPPILLAYNSTLSSLLMRGCVIPELACVVEKLGAWAVRRIDLVEPKQLLLPHQLQGLRGVEYLVMRSASLQTSVPYAALSTLPSLRTFRLRTTNITTLSPPPALLHTLETLDLGRDSIAELPRGVFKNMPNLTTLQLTANNIQNISVGAFEGLGKLTTLDLDMNPLRELRRGVLQDVPTLRSLVLGEAQLTDLEGDALEQLEQLEEIKILDGSNLTLHRGAFSSLTALHRILIKSTTLHQLPPKLLQNLKAITSIELITCRLQKLPEQLFRDQVNLETLSLSDNKIANLPETLFRTMKKLKYLDLSKNEIQVLENNLFAGHNDLVTFDASSNRLATIEANAFLGTPNLQTVNLDSNNLTLISDPREEEPASPFKYLRKLETLKLSRNKIPTVMSDWRISLIFNLKSIDLSSNNITTLKKKDTQFFGKQRTVDFRHNNITTIELGDDHGNSATLLLDDNPYNCDCHLFPILNYTRKHATKLKLDSAECYAPQNLKGKLLNTLPLASMSCSLPDCPPTCNCSIVPATSSISIDCVYPPIFYPKPYDTDVMLKLQHLEDPLRLPTQVVSLNISHTNLTTVPDLPATLQVIDLRHNQLATIPQEITQRNVTLYIAGNPLECICAYQDDIKMLLHGGAVIADMAEATCIDGELSGLSLIHI